MARVLRRDNVGHQRESSLFDSLGRDSDRRTGLHLSGSGARYFTHLTSSLELRLRERFYTQGAASFYQDNYASVQKYMTYDRELSPLWSETFGAALYYLFTPRLEGELKADLFYYSYADFPPLSSRIGTNIGAGISVSY